MYMKKIITKKIMLYFFVFGLFLINTNNAGAQVYVSGPEINNLPLCDSTYRINCPYNVRCRNINGMIAFACPAAYANQPANTNYINNYVNNSDTNYHNYNYSNINYSNNNYNNVAYNVRTNYNFVNSPVYYENGAYYTNPVVRPYYDLATTYSNNYDHNYYYSY